MESHKSDVSLRDQIVPVPTGQSFFDVVRGIAVSSIEALVDPIGFLPYVRVKEPTPFSISDARSIEALRKRIHDEGFRISALLVATDFSGDEADLHVDWAVRVVHAARELQAPVVRIDTWTVKRDLSPAQVRDNFVQRVQRVLEKTSQTGVDLGMENHGPISNDETFLDEVLAAVPDPRLGLTLDTGNLYWYGYAIDDVYRLVEKYAPKAVHTHIKNVNYPPAMASRKREVGYEYKQHCSTLYDGNLDIRRLVELLRRGGYQRDFCIEDESLFKYPEQDKLQVLGRDVQVLQAAMQ